VARGCRASSGAGAGPGSTGSPNSTARRRRRSQLSNGATNAITLTGASTRARYGNQLTVTVDGDHAADPTNKLDVVLYLAGSEVERYTFAKTNITDLAAQINGTTPYTASYQASDWATAGTVTSGTALSTGDGAGVHRRAGRRRRVDHPDGLTPLRSTALRAVPLQRVYAIDNLVGPHGAGGD
jgi:hypothetical protein